MFKQNKLIYAVAGFFLFSSTYALQVKNQDTEFIVSGFMALDFLTLPRADYAGIQREDGRSDRINVGISAFFESGENFSGRIKLLGQFFNPWPGQPSKPQSYRMRLWTSILEGAVKYEIKSVIPSEFEVGYFAYDYNSSNTNLGDYLFKSQIYPGNLFTDFDFPQARVMGIRWGNTMFDGIYSQDLFLTSEIKGYPKSDLSITYMGKINVSNVLTLGGGVSFHNLIPATDQVTNYDEPENTYLEIQPQMGYIKDPNGVVIDSVMLPTLVGLQDRMLGFYNNSSPDTVKYYEAIFDTAGNVKAGIKHKETVYSFQGTKLVAHGTVRPFQMISGLADLFGNNDFKIYGEVAVLGLKDYAGFYPDVRDRMPMMWGVQIPDPTLILVQQGILKKRLLWDVLAYEREFYSNPHSNDYENVFTSGMPQPGSKTEPASDFLNGRVNNADNVKWSIYAKRELVPGFSVIGQVAKDHLRLIDMNDLDYQSVIKNKNDWYWVVRLLATF